MLCYVTRQRLIFCSGRGKESCRPQAIILTFVSLVMTKMYYIYIYACHSNRISRVLKRLAIQRRLSVTQKRTKKLKWVSLVVPEKAVPIL